MNEIEMHTCHEECPCHSGGEPPSDFIEARTVLSQEEWFTRLAELEQLQALKTVARRRRYDEIPRKWLDTLVSVMDRATNQEAEDYLAKWRARDTTDNWLGLAIVALLRDY